MTPAEIKKVLHAHKKWIDGVKSGKRANLSGADLYGASLYGANLSGANLSGASLYGANLSGANLYGANLYGADLSGANLYGASLSGASLYGASLYGADLYGASLYGADLSGANLSSANLSGAKIAFKALPSIAMLASFELGELSDELTLELMRRDAWAHPKPEAFDAWASGGPCPYQNEDRFWKFFLKCGLWKPGPPEIRDSDLILAICREKGWKVKGYIG